MGFNKKVLSKAVSELDKAKAPGKPKDIITDPMGQWKYPGQETRIPGSSITMQGVNYPVWAQPNVGPGAMMQPNQDYEFPNADYVDETPMARKGGTAGKLSNDNGLVTKVVPMKFDLPELKGAEKINDKVTLAMSPDSTGLYKIGKDIEKFCGIPEADVIRDVKAGKDKPEDAIIYGMSNIMNGGKDIYLWINATRLQGSAKEKGVDAAIMEIVSHESLHITRKLLTRAIAKSKGVSVDNEDWVKHDYGDGEYMWPAIGDVSEKHPIVQIDEEAFATAEGYVTERILPHFLEMAKKYLDINKDKLFKKGGTLQSKKYSSNISATNKLFTKNKLFQNKKSKIFDPNSKFKSGGSKLGPINLDPNPLSHYELNYGYNLPTKQKGGLHSNPWLYTYNQEDEEGNPAQVIGTGADFQHKSGLHGKANIELPFFNRNATGSATSELGFGKRYKNFAGDVSLQNAVNPENNPGTIFNPSLKTYIGYNKNLGDHVNFGIGAGNTMRPGKLWNPGIHAGLTYSFQDGGENEDEYMDLTDEEIQAYKEAGYEVDEEPEYEIGGYVQHEIAKAQGGLTKKPVQPVTLKKGNNDYINPSTHFEKQKTDDSIITDTDIVPEGYRRMGDLYTASVDEKTGKVTEKRKFMHELIPQLAPRSLQQSTLPEQTIIPGKPYIKPNLSELNKEVNNGQIIVPGQTTVAKTMRIPVQGVEDYWVKDPVLGNVKRQRPVTTWKEVPYTDEGKSTQGYNIKTGSYTNQTHKYGGALDKAQVGLETGEPEIEQGNETEYKTTVLPEFEVKAEKPEWAKLQDQYEKNTPYKEYFSKRKEEYIKRRPKNLTKLMGIGDNDLPESIAKNIYNDYQYKKNNYITKNLGYRKTFNPRRHGEWVDNLTNKEKEIVSNSRYGKNIQPSLWARTAAGAQELGNFLVKNTAIPSLMGNPDKDVFNYRIPGMSTKNFNAIHNSGTGALETLAIADIPGAIIANAMTNPNREQPGWLSGQLMGNVTPGTAAGLNPLLLTGAGEMMAGKSLLGLGADALRPIIKTGTKYLGKTLGTETGLLSNASKLPGSSSSTKGTDYIWKNIDKNIVGELPEGITKQQIADILESKVSWIESPEYAKRRMATTGETLEEVANDVQKLKTRYENTKIHFKPIKEKGAAGFYQSKPFQPSKDMIVVDPARSTSLEDMLGTLDHEIDHALSPAQKNNKLYNNYPFMPTGMGDAHRAALKKWPQSAFSKFIKGDKSKVIPYLEQAPEQQVRFNRLNQKIREDLNLTRNEGELTTAQFDEWVNKQKENNFESLDEGHNDVADLLLNKSASMDRPAILKILNEAWSIVPIAGTTGILGAGALQQKRFGGEESWEDELNDREIALLRRGGYIVEDLD